MIMTINVYRLNRDFVNQANGKADIVDVDFTNSSAAAETFQKWASVNTKNGLKLEEMNFDPLSKLVLASALFFKSNWLFRFEPATKGVFHAPGGDIDVDMMHMKQRFSWGKLGEIAEWAALPYESDECLIIILPNQKNNLDTVIDQITGRDLANLMYEFNSESNDVSEV